MKVSIDDVHHRQQQKQRQLMKSIVGSSCPIAQNSRADPYLRDCALPPYSHDGMYPIKQWGYHEEADCEVGTKATPAGSLLIIISRAPAPR